MKLLSRNQLSLTGIPRSQERAICELILGDHILQMEYA